MTEKPLHVQVAEALGWTSLEEKTSFGAFEWMESECWIGAPPVGMMGKVPRYDTDWSATGPLVFKYKITLSPWQAGWSATAPQEIQTPLEEAYLGRIRWTGSQPEHTPLIAVCHLIITLKKAGKL